VRLALPSFARLYVDVREEGPHGPKSLSPPRERRRPALDDLHMTLITLHRGHLLPLPEREAPDLGGVGRGRVMRRSHRARTGAGTLPFSSFFSAGSLSEPPTP
jgi:hypothetical protein